MNVKTRIAAILLLGKMKQNRACSEALGIEDASRQIKKTAGCWSSADPDPSAHNLRRF